MVCPPVALSHSNGDQVMKTGGKVKHTKETLSGNTCVAADRRWVVVAQRQNMPNGLCTQSKPTVKPAYDRILHEHEDSKLSPWIATCGYPIKLSNQELGKPLQGVLICGDPPKCQECKSWHCMAPDVYTFIRVQEDTCTHGLRLLWLARMSRSGCLTDTSVKFMLAFESTAEWKGMQRLLLRTAAAGEAIGHQSPDCLPFHTQNGKACGKKNSWSAYSATMGRVSKYQPGCQVVENGLRSPKQMNLRSALTRR